MVRVVVGDEALVQVAENRPQRRCVVKDKRVNTAGKVEVYIQYCVTLGGAEWVTLDKIIKKFSTKKVNHLKTSHDSLLDFLALNASTLTDEEIEAVKQARLQLKTAMTSLMARNEGFEQ